MLNRVITDDEADLDLLMLAGEKRKFAIQLDYPMDPPMQRAFERGIDKEWFTLVDVSSNLPFPCTGRVMRVFRLTDAGMTRLAELGRTRAQA